MRVAPGGHRVNETEIVRQLSQVGQHLGNHFAGLAARLEFPERLVESAVLSLKSDEFLASGHRLAMALNQFRFVIPCFQVAARARAEDDENIACFGNEVGRTRGIGTLGRPLRTERLLRREESLLG